MSPWAKVRHKFNNWKYRCRDWARLAKSSLPHSACWQLRAGGVNNVLWLTSVAPVHFHLRGGNVVHILVNNGEKAVRVLLSRGYVSVAVGQDTIGPSYELFDLDAGWTVLLHEAQTWGYTWLPDTNMWQRGFGPRRKEALDCMMAIWLELDLALWATCGDALVEVFLAMLYTSPCLTNQDGVKTIPSCIALAVIFKPEHRDLYLDLLSWRMCLNGNDVVPLLVESAHAVHKARSEDIKAQLELGSPCRGLLDTPTVHLRSANVGDIKCFGNSRHLFH